MNGTIQYTIRPYDTIWMLAQVFNTTVDDIMKLNPGIDPRNLFVGQVITLRPGYQFSQFPQGAPTTPIIPSRPITPGTSRTPGTPSMPGTPGMPTTPSMPSMPGTPGMPTTPSMPSMPGTPGMPTTPSMPSTPGTPSRPTTPGTSGTPSMPSTPGTSGTPSRPTTPTTPGTSGTPSMPSMPTTQSMQGGMTNSSVYYSNLSNVDGMGNMDGMDEMEDMDDLDQMEDIDQDLERLKDYFRILWEQHVLWTKIAVIAIIHDLPETQLIVQRLLRNPVDFANALTPFYGKEAANEFGQLLTEHLTIAAELVKAAKAGDSNAFADANKRWHDNADQIAALLGSINPYWSEDDWSAMLDEHLELLSNNVAQMLAGEYEESINGFDEIEMQALEMADMMAQGIAMQFSGL